MIPNIDTLVVHFDMENYELEMKELLLTLEIKKEAARLLAASSETEKVLIEFEGMTFQVMPNGDKSHAYILHNDYFQIKLARYRPKKEDYYPINACIKSETLWAYGHDGAWRFLKSVLESMNIKNTKNKISRMDMCCHTDALEVTLESLDRFKGYYRKEELHRDNRKTSGLCLGSRKNRKIYCRIYDKTLEIKEKKKKLWFREIWEGFEMNPEKVWNVEFELNRKIFKEFGIESVEDAYGRIKDLWKYCTEDWLVYTEKNASRIERSDTNPEWKRIQEAFVEFEGVGYIEKRRQDEMDAEARIPVIMGTMTSYGAAVGIKDGERLLKEITEKGLDYLYRARKTTLKHEIERKMAAKGVSK